MAILECRNVSKLWGGVLGLRPVSFTLEAGQHLAITGPSGSGKTTLLRILAGLLEPTGGQVLEEGEPVNGPARCKAPHTRSLGMLFQGLGLWPHLTVRRNVELSLPSGKRSAAGSLSKRERRARAESALEEVGMAALASRFPGDLSGGERQRVAWARAVLAKPRLLLLDEPLTSLDPRLREELLELTEKFGREPGRAIVAATHDPELARRLGGNVLELD